MVGATSDRGTRGFWGFPWAVPQAAKTHSAAQQGATHRILMEAPDMGRTEQFTEVTLTTPRTEGEIITATITGRDGQRLVA